jgi:Tannase and feruloyl esterase
MKQTTPLSAAGLSAMALAAASAALISACSTPGPLLGADPKSACEALSGQSIDAAQIVWPGQTSGAARIDSAAYMPAGAMVVAPAGPTPAATITPAMPAFCKVLGRIAPVDPKAEAINFQVNLPTAWNGRSVQHGGGGFNGVLITGLGLVPGARYDAPAPLALGYATVGTDSGHQNKPGVPPMVFALNDEMLVNFAHAAYPKVRNVAVELMKRAYGRGPEKLYFVGSSEGGREGLTMAQRYPAAFDGIFSRVPVINWTGLQFAGTRNGAATFGDGWLNAAQVKLVADATLAACDKADGVADGVVSNPVGCLTSFKPESLLCAAGASGDTCLNAAQVKAVQTLRSPFKFPYPLANGVTEYPGWSIGGENTAAVGPTGGWRAWWTGTAAPTLPPLPANGIAWFYGGGALQYFYARDPNVDPRSITPENAAARVREVSALMDSTQPDLSAFHARGGKLIVLEHMSDYAQSPFAGIQYVESVQRLMGPKAAEFLRLYTAPGVDHVGTGGPALEDMLGAVSAWVEKGEAPKGLRLLDTDSKPPFAVKRSRPLCEWPLWPRYRGIGDSDVSVTFECTK